MLVPALSHLFSSQRVFSRPASPTPRGDVQDLPPSSKERSVSLPELLRHEDRELGLWWAKGMRAAYHQGTFSDLDTKAVLEAVVTKDASNGVRQWAKRGT